MNSLLAYTRLLRAGWVMAREGVVAALPSEGLHGPARLGYRIAAALARPASKSRDRAQRLGQAVDRLGPSYVKLCQFLATRPDVVGGGGLGGLVRGFIIRCLAPGEVPAIDTRIQFLGLARSGRVDFSYIDAALRRLRPGNTYELMCHPGYHDAMLARDEKLLRYHDWDLERRTLQDPRIPELMRARGVELVSFGALAALQAA